MLFGVVAGFISVAVADSDSAGITYVTVFWLQLRIRANQETKSMDIKRATMNESMTIRGEYQ